MNKNHTSPKPVHFKPKALVLAVRRALPFLLAFSLGAAVVGPAAGRSGENAAAFTATQLIRQFTLKNTVAQVSQGMQGYVQEVNGFLRAPAMGVRPSGFPADMGSVPATVNLPRRDGAGRPLGYCAWDNASVSSDANHLAGSGVPSPLAYAVISPGLNGAMETTCANVLATGTGQSDDFVQVTAPAQASSKQFRSAVSTVAELLATPAEEGDVRLVAENNKLYSYLGGNWTPVNASQFADDSVANGAGALAYIAGKVTVADFQAATATVTGVLAADSGVFTNGVTATTFTGSGSGLTDLNAGNISSGVVGTAFGGTGVDGSAAAQGSLLIGTGAGFALGAITAGDGIGVLNGAGSITISNTGVLSITGTADQIVANASNGDVVLSLPQGIATTSTPTFAGMMLNGALMAPSATFSGDISARRLYLSDSSGGVITPNLVIGLGAMAVATSGDGANTAVGIGALAANTTGDRNTAIGEGALNANITGNLNVAVGHSALRDNTTGSLNTALGTSALRFNVSGSNNIAVGDGALYNNLTGNLNTAVGRSAMISNLDGYNNTALGEAALYNNTSGYDNVAVGKHTLFSNTTGYENTTLGVEALWHNTTGIGNVALGRHAGFYSETGSNNTFLGTSAIPLAVDLNYATAIGAHAEVSTSNTIVLGRTTDRTVIGATGDDGSGNLLQITGNAGVSGDLVLTASGAGGTLGSKIRFGGEDEGTDPIFLGRTNNSADNSILQLTLGDNPSDGFGSNGDRFQIATTNGSVRHSFDSNGNAYHAGALTVGSLTATRLDVGTSAGVTHPNTIVGIGAMPGAQSGNGGNLAVGQQVLQNNTTGHYNTGLGIYALGANQTGARNTAVGYSALIANTTGSRNSVVGYRALYSNLTGDYNVAMGYYAMQFSTEGSYNVVLGNFGLGHNTTGSGNSVLGDSAMFNNSTGFQNVALGRNSMYGNTTGFDNVAVGHEALISNISGSGNSAVGKSALWELDSGSENTAMGQFALYDLVTGSRNVALGTEAGSRDGTRYLASGSDNMFLGAYSGPSAGVNTLNFATAIGAYAEVSTDNTIVLGRTTDTTVIGATGDNGSGNKLQVSGSVGVSGTLFASRIGVGNYEGGVGDINLAIGYEALAAAQSGFGGNLAVGEHVLEYNSTGDTNTALGNYAMHYNETGTQNTAVGYDALQANLSGSSNTAVGWHSMYYNTTGSSNTAVGDDAMAFNTTGERNIAVGRYALYVNEEGTGNSAIGYYSMGRLLSGSENSTLGNYALDYFSSGSRNVAIGSEAGSRTMSRYLTSGSDNSFLGAYSGPASGFNTLNFATAIGAYAEVSTSNTVVLGRTSDRVVIGATGTDGSGNKLQVTGSIKATAFNTSSDRRLKNSITQLDSSNLVSQLQQLNAYQYRFNSDPTGQIRYGVIAQEVATLFPHAVSYDSQGLMAVDYGALGAIAATAVGQLSTQVSAINQQVKTNTENITTLTDRMGTAEEKIDALEGWRTQAEGRMDNLQTAIDKNIADIAKNAVAITANTQRIDTLEEVTALLDARTTEYGSLITVLQAQWSDTFSRADDGQTLVVNAPNLKASNFSAQQASIGTVYSERLMAEMAKIKALEVDSLLVNTAQARTVRAEEMNTGSAQVYAGVGLPALLFAATADGHYTVNTSALDGSYATATVIVNAGQAKIVPVASEGIELVAEGNTVKAIAAGKSIKASWIKMG